MKYNIRLLSVALLFLSLLSVANEAHAQVVNGQVVNAATKEPIPFANVTFPRKNEAERQIGVSADKEGRFTIAFTSLPAKLEITALGYLKKLITITSATNNLVVELQEDYTQLQDVVITSEKVTQEELKAPIERVKIDLVELQSAPSFNFFDALANIKGVDLTTQSVVINSVNTRGFNSTTNQRFRQFTDGIDNQAPGLSFSLGNIVGPSNLDIESIELVPGPSSAFYGPSSFNGVLEMRTKNPFDYPGVSFAAKAATVSVEKDRSSFLNIGDNFIQDFSARAAFHIKDKVGFKFNASVLDGVDFRARNYDNIGPGEPFEAFHSSENQSINLVNVYGDDRSAFLVVPQSFGQSGGEGGGLIASERDTAFRVTREGYREEDLVNYDARNVKFSAEMQIRLTPKVTAIFASHYGVADAMITGEDRFALRDFSIIQHKAEINGEKFLLRAYSTEQDAGNTFNVGLLADNIIQTAKPDEIWFAQYQRIYNAGRGVVSARNFAESAFPDPNVFQRRFEPETERFDSLRNLIVASREPGFGARIFDKSKLYHIEGKYDLDSFQDYFSRLTVGGAFRMVDPNSQGTIFTDSLDNDVTNYEYGSFIEATKELNWDTELTGSIRYDKNENFQGKFSQRLSAVKQHKDIHFFRASLQRGFRFPNVREQFYNQDLGDVRLLGGLDNVANTFNLTNNSFIQQSLEAYNDAVEQSINEDAVKFEQAKLLHLDILENGVIQPGRFNDLQPERITSFELGYRSLIQERRLIEITFYRNYYDNFIGNLRLVKPRTSPLTDLERAAEQANSPGSSDVFFVIDNAEDQIITQGLEILYDITGLSGINFSVNATFADIIQNSNDPIVPGFNTPPFKWNVKVGHRRIGRNFGAEFIWRSRTEFEWQSPFADGTVEGFSTFDIQMTWRMPGINSILRIGGNNLQNRRQFNSFGGPEISAFYYVNFTYDPFQSR